MVSTENEVLTVYSVTYGMLHMDGVWTGSSYKTQERLQILFMSGCQHWKWMF